MVRFFQKNGEKKKQNIYSSSFLTEFLYRYTYITRTISTKKKLYTCHNYYLPFFRLLSSFYARGIERKS